MEVVDDEYGAEAFQARIYYRGPLQWSGSPRSIRLDMSRGEHLAFPTVQKLLLHGYTDAQLLPEVQIGCYSLAEMLAEKLRAICGQRRFIIARDLYDLYHLSQTDVPFDAVRSVLPAKFAAKGIDLPVSIQANLEAKRPQFSSDWDRRLVYLLPPADPVTFEIAWEAVQSLVTELQL